MTPRLRLYWQYFKHVLDHKRRVYAEGRRLADPCGRWQLVVHDLSKFSRREFDAYARHFQGKDFGLRKEKELDQAEFDAAWLHHIHHNPHHWDYWVLRVGKTVTALRMPEKFVREMAADWLALASKTGASKVAWYERNKDTLHMHPATRSRIEVLIGYKPVTPDVVEVARVVAGVPNANGRIYGAETLERAAESQRAREVL